MTIATHFQKYFSISATKLITELKTKNSRKKREHGPWPYLIPIPPSSRRITLTYEVMIFVFSAQCFLLPPSKITLTYEVMMAARLLCPDPNVPDVRSVRKCPPTPPGLPRWCPQYPQVSRNNQQRPQPCPMLAPGPKGNDTLWCVSPFH